MKYHKSRTHLLRDVDAITAEPRIGHRVREGGLGNGTLTPTTQYIERSQDTYASSSARPDTGDCYAEFTTSIAVTASRLLSPRNSTSGSGGSHRLEGHDHSDTPPARNVFTYLGGSNACSWCITYWTGNCCSPLALGLLIKC